MAIQENQFFYLSRKIISDIADKIALADVEGIIEIDFKNDGILHLKINHEEFIITSHNAAKQIWLVSPLTGPHHFNFTGDKWFGRNDEDMLDLLNKQIYQLTNINLKM